MPDNEQVELFEIREGKYGRDHRHSYRDEELLVQAEKDRAFAEGREPDFSPENLRSNPSVGSVLVERKDLPTTQYVGTNGKYDGHPGPSVVLDTPQFVAAGSGDVDLSYAAQVAKERSAQNKALEDVGGDSGSDATNATDEALKSIGSGKPADPMTGGKTNTDKPNK